MCQKDQQVLYGTNRRFNGKPLGHFCALCVKDMGDKPVDDPAHYGNTQS
jgi:hypothetical protein